MVTIYDSHMGVHEIFYEISTHSFAPVFSGTACTSICWNHYTMHRRTPPTLVTLTNWPFEVLVTKWWWTTNVLLVVVVCFESANEKIGFYLRVEIFWFIQILVEITWIKWAMCQISRHLVTTYILLNKIQYIHFRSQFILEFSVHSHNSQYQITLQEGTQMDI